MTYLGSLSKWILEQVFGVTKKSFLNYKGQENHDRQGREGTRCIEEEP